MDNQKTDGYYLKKIIGVLSFIIEHTRNLTKKQLEEQEILLDSMLFRLIRVSENTDRLTDAFKEAHASVPWRAMKGLRNRIVHEYGNVDLQIVFDTIKRDVPLLLTTLKAFYQDPLL